LADILSMKTNTLSTLLLTACCASTCLLTDASAQRITVVNGKKVLVDAKGNVTVPRPAVVQLPTAPLVGGADSCVTPDVITGAGPFAFDNTLATTGTQGQSEGNCNLFATTGISNDVWFTWTANVTGSVNVSMCGQASMDSKLAVYPGNTCPTTGSSLACDDDFCSGAGPSQVTINVTAGQQYVIQIGNYPSAAPGTGTFTIAPPPPPPSNDNCATPTTIVGTGSFPYDTTAATTGSQGQAESLCNQFGSIVIHNDLWYTWVAPFTGTARVSNCGATNGDTKFAAYAGAGCPASGTAIACNDQACGSNASTIDFAVTAGSTYTLQIGDYEFAQPGPGTFTISQFFLAANDDCSTATPISGSGNHTFDLGTATTGTQQPGCATANDDVWFAYTATSTGSTTASTCGLTTSNDTDTVMAVYAGATCPTGSAVACNDDTCGLQSSITFSTTCGNTYLIQVGGFNTGSAVTGSFSVAETGTSCGPTGVPYCFGDGSGTPCPCGNNGAPGNGCANSVNPNGANLTTTGNASLANDTLVLHGSGMPNAACLYFQGTTQVNAQFGDGLRCAGGTIVRLLTKVNVNGQSQYPDPGNPPIHIRGQVTTPGTRTYQCWYRNAAVFCTPSTFNLTNGVLVTWQ
jgi:hypothetical protein